MKLDILAIGAHPDDIELSCAGTLIAHISKGGKAGVVDLTHGEMGTRGTPELRQKEAANAAVIMGLSARENLGFRDSFFSNHGAHQLEIVRIIRTYQPDIVLANAVYDRHPDHGRGASVVEEAFFKAGLSKLVTKDLNGREQPAWRPKHLYHYIQSVPLEPDFLVDISDAMDRKMEAIKAYQSQFYDPNSTEPATYISSEAFLRMIEARASELGHRIGVKYAEGFTTKHPLGVGNLFDLK